MCVTHHYRVKMIVLSLLLATSNVSTVSQGIVRMQGLPFRATGDDIVSTVLIQWSCPCACVLGLSDSENNAITIVKQ